MNDTTRGGAAGTRIPLAGFVLDLGASALRDASGRDVPLRPRAWAVLRLLASRAGQLVTKDELMREVWADVVVTEDSLTQAVSDVREALGEAGHRVVKTMPRRGYMLVADAVAEPVAVSAEDIDEADRPSIAVLPFTGPEGDAASDSLARGVARDLVAELARNADLRVASHHSSFLFAARDVPIEDVGRRLHSRFIVDGRVRRDGETLHVDIELIESRGGRLVWTTQHAAQAEQLTGLQTSLVQRIARSVHGKAQQTDRWTAPRSPKNLDVYALTVRGINLMTVFSLEAFASAREALEKALAIDPQYAPAWAWLGYVNVMDHLLWGEAKENPAELAEQCVRQLLRALELDPTNVAAYRGLTWARNFQRDHDAALAAALRAVELAPSSGDCLVFLAVAQLYVGRSTEALETSAAAFPPGVPMTGWQSGQRAFVSWANKRYEEALLLADESIAKTPAYATSWLVRAYALVELGRVEEAKRAAATLLSLTPSRTTRYSLDRFADSAVELRERVRRCCAAAGIPP